MTVGQLKKELDNFHDSIEVVTRDTTTPEMAEIVSVCLEEAEGDYFAVITADY